MENRNYWQKRMKALENQSYQSAVQCYQDIQEEYRKAAVDAVRKLASDVGIPKDLKGIAKEEDVRFLSESAVADACAPGNPKEATLEDIEMLYRKLL